MMIFLTRYFDNNFIYIYIIINLGKKEKVLRFLQKEKKNSSKVCYTLPYRARKVWVHVKWFKMIEMIHDWDQTEILQNDGKSRY